MKELSGHVLELVRSVASRPKGLGSPEAVSGMVAALVIVALWEEMDAPPFSIRRQWARPIQEYVSLLIEATSDVPRPRERAVQLCDECLEPERRVSYEAFSRHTCRLLELLEKRVAAGAFEHRSWPDERKQGRS